MCMESSQCPHVAGGTTEARAFQAQQAQEQRELRSPPRNPAFLLILFGRSGPSVWLLSLGSTYGLRGRGQVVMKEPGSGCPGPGFLSPRKPA